MTNTTRSCTPVKRFSAWNYVLLVLVLVSSVVYALPNVYGNDPSLVISNSAAGKQSEPEIGQQVLALLDSREIRAKSMEVEKGRLLVRLNSVDAQFKAYDTLKGQLPTSYSVTYSLASRSPQWFASIGASPMHLGLDLQGGIHLLYDVDMEAAIIKAQERYMAESRLVLSNANIHYQNIEHFKSASSRGILIDFSSTQDREAARNLLNRNMPELAYTARETGNTVSLLAALPAKQQKEIKRIALEKNISTLRNRVNELGVSEPIVQRQGLDRIVVELPGIQDPEYVKQILGSTATLEFRLAYE